MRRDRPDATDRQDAPGFALSRLAGTALSGRRQVFGFVVALTGGPLLTWLLIVARSEDTITIDVLAYQLLVVIVALTGGIWPALFAAIMSGITLSFFFVEPVHTVSIADPRNAWSLVLYVVIAALVSVVVDRAARASRAARRATGEAELLVTVAGSVLRGESAVPAMIARAREVLRLSGVRLVAADGTVLATDGEPVRDESFTSLAVGSTPDGAARATLELHGHALDGSERRLVAAIVSQLSAVLEHTELAETAREAGALAETDQVRSALLSAASHDLRRPLAVAVAAVGGLRASDALSPEDREELLATADESLSTLSRLVTDLLDVSRVQAGVLGVSLSPIDAAGAVLSALDELALGPDDVELELDPDLPALHADGVLLQRVLVNVLANAHRHSPSDVPVLVTTARLGAFAEIRIADRGPGVPPDRRDDMFSPFQRLGDTDNTTGLGLGLALSKGFTEGMGGTLSPVDTPGGGLTMVVSLRIWIPSPAEDDSAGAPARPEGAA